MAPPQAEIFASRLVLGPALRAQPDRRLVKLVREGYEAAFEEIVRRYRKPLDRFAAAIVGARSEDVTQDAFSKALLALRGSEQEIELKPWLYRIVRNTALNDLRDRPQEAEQLGEAIEGGHSAAFEAERREEMRELMGRLQALPEPQRAAIVMRELEGLSHEEIAAALGVSGGAARQAIHRARTSLRNGFGLLVPLPLLRFLFDHADVAGGAAAAAGAGAGGTAAGALGGAGGGAALKVGVATVLIAGSVGAGVAVEQSNRGAPEPARAAQTISDDSGSQGSDDSGGHGAEPGDDHGGGGGGESGDDSGGHGGSGSGDDHGGGPGPSGGSGDSSSGSGSSGSGSSGSDDSSRRSGSNSGSGSTSSGPGSGASSGGSGTSSSGSSGTSGSSGGSGSTSSGSGSSGSSGGSGSSGSSGSSSGGSGSSGGSDDGSGSGSPDDS